MRLRDVPIRSGNPVAFRLKPVLLAALLALSSGLGSVTVSHSAPLCPSDGSGPVPAFGKTGQRPNVEVWSNFGGAASVCAGVVEEPAELIVAIAGRLRHDGTVESLARRLGAISGTKGLEYWSTVSRRWRVLITDAYAISGNNVRNKRPDFTAEEILSGRVLSFVQDDTRSSGKNVTSLTTMNRSAGSFAFQMRNGTPIRKGPIVLFDKGAVRSVHFVERVRPATWQYYSLSLVRRANYFSANSNSLLNRLDAFHRYLFELPLNRARPLAR